MKNTFLLAAMLITLSLSAQENIVNLMGGYAFANIEDSDIKATGYRINGSYEFNPLAGNIAHGIAFGYINVKAEEVIGAQTVEITVGSIPIYYAPKLMFGNETIKGYAKLAIGTQFSSIKKSGVVSLSDNDFGFYGGGGAGIIYNISEKVFINAEYEIAWLSNSWYKDGWMNSAMAGIGFRF